MLTFQQIACYRIRINFQMMKSALDSSCSSIFLFPSLVFWSKFIIVSSVQTRYTERWDRPQHARDLRDNKRIISWMDGFMYIQFELCCESTYTENFHLSSSSCIIITSSFASLPFLLFLRVVYAPLSPPSSFTSWHDSLFSGSQRPVSVPYRHLVEMYSSKWVSDDVMALQATLKHLIPSAEMNIKRVHPEVGPQH